MNHSIPASLSLSFLAVAGGLFHLGAVSPAFSAIILDAEMISKVKQVSPPEDRSFPQGYEVVAEPTAGAKPIKVMPAGLAKVAAYLDVEGRRYYMTDWSYDRLKEGLSYNWIRPVGAGQSGGAVSSSGGGGSYRITGVPAGETLNIRTGPGTNFAVAGELSNGKDGIQITGDAVMNGEAEWVPVSYPGGKGWTRTKYLARASGGGASSGATSASAAPAPGRKILKSTLHGLTLSVKLPSDMTEIEVTDEAMLNENGGAHRDELQNLVFQGWKSRKSAVTLKRITSFSADQRPTAEDVSKDQCMELERAVAAQRRWQSFTGTFLGKPAFAVLNKYFAGVEQGYWMMFSIVTLEPINGRFYKLSYTLTKDDEGYGMSPQELVSSVMLVHAGEPARLAASPAVAPVYQDGVRVITLKPRNFGDNPLAYDQTEISAKSGEKIKLVYKHTGTRYPCNVVLCKPGSGARVRYASNEMVADPSAMKRSFVPNSADVIAFTELAQPGQTKFTEFTLPPVEGTYEFFCSFPGLTYIGGTLKVTK